VVFEVVGDFYVHLAEERRAPAGREHHIERREVEALLVREGNEVIREGRNAAREGRALRRGQVADVLGTEAARVIGIEEDETSLRRAGTALRHAGAGHREKGLLAVRGAHLALVEMRQ